MLSAPSLFSFQVVAVVMLSITFGEALAVERIVSKTALTPLAKLKKASNQVAKGNYNFEISNRKGRRVNPQNDELQPIVDAFGILRHRIFEMEQSLAEAKALSTRTLEKSSFHIAEKERELERRNAMLIGKTEELEKIIGEFSSRNRELSLAYEKLERLDKRKTDFLLIAAHELRTPIQPLLGFARLAQKGLIDRDVAWKSIETEAKKLADMASDILDAGRIESGSFSYKMEPVSVHALLDGITSGSSKVFSESGAVVIAKDLDSDTEILADRARISQALLNIVGNAVKFGGNSQITIRTSNDPERGIVEIEIIDGGMGIDPEVLPILFNKFVTKTEANQRGAGLGLYIAKSIIEAHKGKVFAENNASGTGATFTILFPLLGTSQNASASMSGFEIPN